MEGILLPTSNSPKRFEIPLEMLNLFQQRDDIYMRHTLPIRRIVSLMKNIHLSVDKIQENPSDPKTIAPQDFFTQLELFSKSQGIGLIGFAKLSQDLIFQEYGVLYDNAIILAMEMDKDTVEKAPSQATLNMVFGTYDDLGIATNKVTEFLKEYGYAAQADHPLGGLALFPPMAQKAGIGWVGKHGILITRDFGPRVRLAAVYTSIKNLPFVDSNDHEWIADYCKICGNCIKKCPSNAILESSIEHKSGRITNITLHKCFEYFAQYYGCSVCVKVCPFSKDPDTYSKLKDVVEKGRRRSSA